MSAPIDVSKCCQMVNPCEAKCLIENALVNQAVGKAIMSYKVGDETFQIKLPSIADLRSLLAHYEAQCNLAMGKPSRRRARVCFVYGPNYCNMCQQQGCGGKCR